MGIPIVRNFNLVYERKTEVKQAKICAEGCKVEHITHIFRT